MQNCDYLETDIRFDPEMHCEFIRETLGLSYNDIARDLGVTRQSVIQYENSKGKNPKFLNYYQELQQKCLKDYPNSIYAILYHRSEINIAARGYAKHKGWEYTLAHINEK